MVFLFHMMKPKYQYAWDPPHMIWKTQDPPDDQNALVQCKHGQDSMRRKQLRITMTCNCIMSAIFSPFSNLPLALQKNYWNRRRRDAPPPPASSALRQRRSSPESNSRWPPAPQSAPSAPPLPATFPSLFKAEAQGAKSNVVQMEPQEAQTEYVLSLIHIWRCRRRG